MVSGLDSVTPPTDPVYRISRPPDLFAPPPWDVADNETGTFDGRFDDPGKVSGILESERFRIIYCSSQRRGAFAETIARFRTPIATLGRYGAVSGDGDAQTVHRPVLDPEGTPRPIVPVIWRSRRQIGSVILGSSLRFVDLATPQTMNHLRSVLAHHASTLRLHDVDLSTLTGNIRTFTQLCARYIYEQESDAGDPAYAGIRYLSRLNPAWECWAVFDTRAVFEVSRVNLIREDDPDLLNVAALFNLSVERDEPGEYIRP